jgi:DNA-binding NarL/FixJ family response regulator
VNVLKLLIVEDHDRLRSALAAGFEATGEVQVVASCGSGETAIERCTRRPPDAVLMDVQLSGELNGVAAAVAIRREVPRLPIVFYSMQDDEDYYRAFRRSGILTHYAYVRKSNFLLPEMLVPLIRDAMRGWSFIDPEIENRVEEVRQRDDQDPLALLEPNEQQVARMLAQGLSNEQIAAIMGFRDKRTISRTNGQIYAAWGLADSTTDEKIARTRAAIIVREGRLLRWDAEGRAYALDASGHRIPYELH